MNVFEYLYFITTPIYIEPVFIPGKSMISPCFRNQMSRLLNRWEVNFLTIASLTDFVPLFLFSFILKKVVEICSTLSCIAPKVVNASSIRDGSGAGSGSGKAVNQLKRTFVRISDNLLSLVIHCNIARNN
jgi:hypothetical protein